MDKKTKYSLIIFILVILIILLTTQINKNNSNNSFENPNLTSKNEKAIYFFDKNTNCTLDGEVYLNNQLLGTTSKGSLILSEDFFNLTETNFILTLEGLTSNCFEENQNLPFFREWELNSLDYTIFETNLNPRKPDYYKEMQKFIKPEEVVSELESMYLNSEESLKSNIDRIFSKVHMSYSSDSSRFNENEYWQTPKETLKNRAGDCEDWAVRFLSLILAHNPDSPCYIALWDTHANVICKFNNTIIIYDQSKITQAIVIDNNLEKDSIISQENKIKIRKFLKVYFNEYGLDSTKRNISALFNNREIIEFKDTEEFINWTLNN